VDEVESVSEDLQGPSLVEVVRAIPEDAESLTRVAFAAKRHWGYPERWILRWTESLTIAPEFVRDNEVYVATDGERIVGFYARSWVKLPRWIWSTCGCCRRPWAQVSAARCSTTPCGWPLPRALRP
jgi:hypothetical protein